MVAISTSFFFFPTYPFTSLSLSLVLIPDLDKQPLRSMPEVTFLPLTFFPATSDACCSPVLRSVSLCTAPNAFLCFVGLSDCMGPTYIFFDLSLTDSPDKNNTLAINSISRSTFVLLFFLSYSSSRVLCSLRSPPSPNYYFSTLTLRPKRGQYERIHPIRKKPEPSCIHQP